MSLLDGFVAAAALSDNVDFGSYGTGDFLYKSCASRVACLGLRVCFRAQILLVASEGCAGMRSKQYYTVQFCSFAVL